MGERPLHPHHSLNARWNEVDLWAEIALETGIVASWEGSQSAANGYHSKQQSVHCIYPLLGEVVSGVTNHEAVNDAVSEVTSQ